MSNFTFIHSFFFGDPQKLGIQKIPTNKILSIMADTSQSKQEFPFAEEIGYILIDKENEKIQKNVLANNR